MVDLNSNENRCFQRNLLGLAPRALNASHRPILQAVTISSHLHLQYTDYCGDIRPCTFHECFRETSPTTLMDVTTIEPLPITLKSVSTPEKACLWQTMYKYPPLSFSQPKKHLFRETFVGHLVSKSSPITLSCISLFYFHAVCSIPFLFVDLRWLPPPWT